LAACKSPGDKLDPSNAAELQYPEGTAVVWKAILTALADLDLRVESDHHDALGGRLIAVRATKEKVLVEARTVSEHSTQVAIAVDSIDRNMAGVIHAHIGRLISADTTAAELMGGNSLEATYESNLASCVLAAERTFEAHALEITQRVVHDTRAELVSRKSKATPVLIRMELRVPPAGANGQGKVNADGQAPDKGQIRVTFVAGTTRTPDGEALVRQVKTDFERFLR
jgi:hypothetical protein